MHPLSEGMSCRPNNIHRLLRRRDMSCAPPEPPLHMWEEPCISGTTGSGNRLFLRLYVTLLCSARTSSEAMKTTERRSPLSRLSDIFLELQEKGAANINLVTGTQFAPSIIRALDLAKPKLQIPVVFNCGGYEKLETIQ